MRRTFNSLTKKDVEALRKKRSYIPEGGKPIIYNYTLNDILDAKKHLETLYKGRVTLPFAERILLLNDIYNNNEDEKWEEIK